MSVSSRLLGRVRVGGVPVPLRKRLCRYAGFVWVLVVLIYFLIETWSYSGLFAKLAEWQFVALGHSWPMASFLMLVAFFSLPGIVLLATSGMPGAPEESEETEVVHARRTLSIFRVVGSCFALASLACLVPTVFHGMYRGEAQEIRADLPSEVGSGEGFTRIRGSVLISRTAVLDQNLIITRRQLRLAPVLPAANEKAVRYFVQVTPDEIEKDRRGQTPQRQDGQPANPQHPRGPAQG